MELNTENIKILAQIMSKENITSIDLANGNLKIKMRRDFDNNIALTKPIAKQDNTSDNMVPDFHKTIETTEVVETIENPGNLVEIKSPMVGVFYESNEPGGAPFVSVGDTFSEGTILCIIEAMKLMNEITSEKSGKIIEKCVINGQVLEYGQVIYRIQEGA
ncbi:MAG: acetyl-CoA carboxylase biotin carboxyl carrier protein [Eubacteriaceae bacterium]